MTPEFLQLPEALLEADKRRQDALRRKFNARVRMSPAEMETARSLILEKELRAEFERNPDDHTANRLAEQLSFQGRFEEAAKVARDPDWIRFYQMAAAAIEAEPCDCPNGYAAVGQERIKLPRLRAIKQIYSRKHGAHGYLVECADGHRFFSNAAPTAD
ncbi:MAG: hypothetical protein JSS81_07465 [Acidobacteria bacterium]|nr:hypothetical protein [Acidobacteriota bacterium]